MIIIINILIVISMIFRFLAIKITYLDLKSGKYNEKNPIGRLLLSKPFIIYGINIINFIIIIIFFNYGIIISPNLSLFVLIVSISFTVIILGDFTWDFICLIRIKRGKLNEQIR